VPAAAAAAGEAEEQQQPPPSGISTLTTEEALVAMRRATDLKAHELLLLPAPAPRTFSASQAPPPLSARLLELAPTMTTPQLAAAFSTYARLTSDARRVPGLRDQWLPPLREAARMLEGGEWGGGGGARAAAAALVAAAESLEEKARQQQQQPSADHHQPVTHQRSLAALGAHDACLVAWAIGHLHVRDEAAAASIAAATADHIAARVGAGDRPHLLVMLAQGLAASGRHHPLAFAAIADAARPAVRARLPPARLTLLARALATARHADEPLFDAVCRAMTPALMREALVYESLAAVGSGKGEEQPEAAAAVAGADANDGAAPSTTATTATTPPTPTRPQLEPYHLAQLLWALAIVRHPLRPEFFAAAAAAAAAMAPRMSAAEASDVAWACARSRAYSPALYDALSKRAQELADGGKLLPRQASQVAWSFARQGHASAPLLSALARSVLQAGGSAGGGGGGVRLLAPGSPAGRDSMLPFNLSNMVWAYGALGAVGGGGGGGGEEPGEQAASSHGGAEASAAPPSPLPLVVPETPALVRALARAALNGRIEDFALQNLSDLAFGLSACGYGKGAFAGEAQGAAAADDQEDARRLYARIADAAAAQAPQLSAHSLADLCWAFAHAGANGSACAKLFAAATASAATPPERLSSAFSLGMLADLVWASARAGHRDDALLSGVADVLMMPGRAEQLARDGEAAAKFRWALSRLPHQGLARALDQAANTVA
jgi:hypothetical protein